MRLSEAFRRKAMKIYVAGYFHAGGINNSWPYIVSRGAPYKERCVKEWGISPLGYVMFVGSFYMWFRANRNIREERTRPAT